MEEEKKVVKPTIGQVFRSVASAAIGVQSEKNRERDFKSTTIWPFIIGGILFTLAFVGALMLLVSTVT